MTETRQYQHRHLLSYLTLLAAVATVVTACSVLPSSSGTSSAGADAHAIQASGFLEGTEVTVASDIDGRIGDIFVDLGGSVLAGDVVVQIDDSALQQQRAQAAAAVNAAQAALQQVREGARLEDIAAARAAQSQAEARYAGATQAVIDARTAITSPQSIDQQITQARTQRDLAAQGVEMAKAQLAATQLKRDVYAERGGDIERTWDLQLTASQAALDQAQAKLDGAKAVLAQLYALRRSPLQLEAALHQAEAEAALAEAQVASAEARVEELEAGPTNEEIAVAEAQVAQAQAALDVLDIQISHLTLAAPTGGVVTSRDAEVGETAVAGAPLLTIANLSDLKLVIYVPESQIGQVHVGRPVSVTIDTFPDRVFQGTVASIAGKAEFTPENVQTEAQRVNLVFAVDVDVPNPDGVLKLGMAADAQIASNE